MNITPNSLTVTQLLGSQNEQYVIPAKASYKNSAIKLTNTLPVEYQDFRFEQVDERSQELSQIAVKLWPAP